MRLAWRMYQNNKALWSQILYFKHCHNKNMFRVQGTTSIPWSCIRRDWRNCKKGSRRLVDKGDKVKFFDDNLIINHDAIRHYIHGPLTKEEQELTVANAKGNGNWNLNNFTVNIPKEVIIKIKTVICHLWKEQKIKEYGASPRMGSSLLRVPINFLTAQPSSPTPLTKRNFNRFGTSMLPIKLKPSSGYSTMANSLQSITSVT